MEDVLRIERQTFTADALPDLVQRLREAAKLGQAIELIRLSFPDGLNLRYFRTGGPMLLRGCTFYGPLDLAQSHIKGGLTLDASACWKGLDLADAEIDGPLTFLTSYLYPFTEHPGDPNDKDWQGDRPCVHAPRLAVGNRLLMRRVFARRSINLISAQIENDVEVLRCQLNHDGLPQAGVPHVVNMNSAEVGGSVFFREGSELRGAVELRSKVLGQVDFSGVTAGVGEGLAVDMELAEVGDSVFFREGSELKGGVDLRSKVSGHVDFFGVTAGVGEGLAVNMASAEIDGSVVFREGSELKGGVDLRSKVSGQVNFSGVTAGVGEGLAVNMASAEVGLFLIRAGCVLRGGLDLTSATLRNGLYAAGDANRSRFDRPNARTLRELLVGGEIRLDFAEIHGPLILHRASVWGGITARHLRVTGDLQICASVVGPPVSTEKLGVRKLLGIARTLPLPEVGQERREWRRRYSLRNVWTAHEFERAPMSDEDGRVSGTALNLEMANIGGRLWLKGSRLLGGVTVEDATIEGELNCAQARVAGDLRLRSASISGTVFGDENGGDGTTAYPCVGGVLDARGATLSEVDIVYTDNGVCNLSGPADPCNGPTRVLLDDTRLQTFRVRGRLPGPPAEATEQERAAHRVFHAHQLRFDEIDVSGLSLDPPAGTGQNGEQGGDAVGAVRSPLGTGWRNFRRWATAGLGLVVLSQFFHPDGTAGDRLTGAVLILLGLVALAWHNKKRDKRKIETGEATTRREKLRLLLDNTAMSPQFYLSVEQAKRAEGDDRLADEVFLWRRRREQKELRPLGDPTEAGYSAKGPDPGLSPAKFAWHEIIDVAIGYGVRSHRVVVLFALLWLLNWSVFLNPRSVERPLSFEVEPVPALSERVAVNDGYPQPDGGPNPWPADGGLPAAGEWHAGHAFFVAMRVQLPLLNLLAEGDWEPSSRPMRVFDEAANLFVAEEENELIGMVSFENYASVMQVTNLVLIPLMIAGATGVLKRRETL